LKDLKNIKSISLFCCSNKPQYINLKNILPQILEEKQKYNNKGRDEKWSNSYRNDNRSI
jgi:hypothetical protein